MTEHIDHFIQTLREELTQYGELLALLETQQQEILARNADEVQACASEIQRQTQFLENLKKQRESARFDLYEVLALRPDADLKDSLNRLPDDYRPLLQALLDENRHSIIRIRKIARQNHLLLNRSLGTVRELIGALTDDGVPSIYGLDGKVPDQSIRHALSYEEVC